MGETDEEDLDSPERLESESGIFIPSEQDLAFVKGECPDDAPSDSDLSYFYDYSSMDLDNMVELDPLEFELTLTKGKLVIAKEQRLRMMKAIDGLKVENLALRRHERLDELGVGALVNEPRRGSRGERLGGWNIPSNSTLEASILGRLISTPALMEEFNQPYLDKMLMCSAHTVIHKAMMDIGSNRLDITNLVDRLRSMDRLESVGGPAYLNSMVEFAKESTNPNSLELALKSLQNTYMRRELVLFAQQLSDDAMSEMRSEVVSAPSSTGTKRKRFRRGVPGEESSYSGRKVVRQPMGSVSEFIRDRSFSMLDLLPFELRNKYDPNATVDEVMSDFHELVKRNGKPKISTGYKKLDDIMHGILPNRLIMVGARTSIGKTTFSLNLADNVANQGGRSVIFTYESSRSELIQKLIAKHTGVDSLSFVYWDKGTIAEEDIAKIDAAQQKVRELPITIDDAKPDIDYVLGRCRHLKTLHPDLSLVVVDALQSYSGYVPYQGNKSDIYYEILKKLKGMAGDLRLTVLVNSQLKIDIEKRKDKRPRGLEDFSDCKGIAEVADTALMLYRPEFYWDKPEYSGWMSVIPAKMRVGHKAEKTFRLGVDLKTARVYDMPQ